MCYEPELIQGGAFAFLNVHCVFIIMTKCYGVNPAPLTGYFQLKTEIIMRI